MVIIALKDGVELWTARPEALEAIQKCAEVCYENGALFAITSITDGEHGRKSLHRYGLAFDVRSRDWDPDQKRLLLGEFQAVLGDGYDVVDEADHTHVEYDP